MNPACGMSMTMNSDREPACGMTTTMNGDRAEGTGLSSHDLFGVGAGQASADPVRLQDVEVRSFDPEFAEGTGLLSRDPLEGAEPSAPENGERLESNTESSAWHPKWAAMRAMLCATELEHVRMEPSGRFLWGKCTLYDAVIDDKHIRGKNHLKKLGPLGVFPADRAVHVPVAGADTPTLAAAAPAASARQLDIHVFYPSTYDGGEVHGAMSVDSFYYLKKSKKEVSTPKPKPYMVELLDEIWQKTGQIFKAVCSGGAAVAFPHGRGAQFSDFLQKVHNELVGKGQRSLECILAVVSGNDLLTGSGVRSFSAGSDASMLELKVRAL